MRQHEPLETLAETVRALVAAGSEPLAYEIALDAAMAASGADMGAVFRPAGLSLRMAVSRNLPHELRRRPPLLDARAWTAQIFVRAHGQEPVGAPLHEAAPLQAIPTWATAPAAPRGRVYGLLLIASRDLVGFPAQALAHLELTATVLGLALAAPAPAPPAPGGGPPPTPTQISGPPTPSRGPA